MGTITCFDCNAELSVVLGGEPYMLGWKELYVPATDDDFYNGHRAVWVCPHCYYIRNKENGKAERIKEQSKGVTITVYDDLDAKSQAEEIRRGTFTKDRRRENFSSGRRYADVDRRKRKNPRRGFYERGRRDGDNRSVSD